MKAIKVIERELIMQSITQPQRCWARRVGARAVVFVAAIAMVSVGAVIDADAGAAAGGRTLTVDDTAAVHLVSRNAYVRVQAGRATGTLPGSATITVDQSGSGLRGTETFHVHGGTIALRGSGSYRIGEGVYASFSGTAVVLGGTGTYAHATGSGTLYGSENRFTHSATVQVLGTIKY